MSTKIFDIYKVKEPINIVLERLKQNREYYINKSATTVLNEVIEYSVSEYDKENCNKDFDDILNDIYGEFLKNDNNIYKSIKNIYRLDFYVYPVSKNVTLVSISGAYNMIDYVKEKEKYWLNEETEYEYYDNTDKPKTISNYRWNKRREFYDKLFNKYFNFNEVFLTYPIINDLSTVLGNNLFYLKNFAINDYSGINLPDNEVRRKNKVFNEIINLANKNSKDENGNYNYEYIFSLRKEFKFKYNNGDYDDLKQKFLIKDIKNSSKHIKSIINKQNEKRD